MKRSITYLIILLIPYRISAQSFEDLQKEYDAFVQQAQAEYNNFVAKANQDYADFVRQAWQRFNAFTAIPEPKDETVPPVVIKDEEKKLPLHDNPVVIEEIINIPTPEPQPQPVQPIPQQPVIEEQKLTFEIFGTALHVSLSDKQKFKIPALTEEYIAQAWEHLSNNAYNNVIRECLSIRTEKHLCDWSYLRMLDNMSNAFLGKNTPEATLLKAYIYCQSGYQMRLAKADNRLIMLYGSQHVIYNKCYWTIDNQRFYPDYEGSLTQAYICNITFPQEKAMSLYVNEAQGFQAVPATERTWQSKDQQWLSVRVTPDVNVISFCDTYPTSFVNDNELTRWAMYANMPLSERVQSQLYPTLQKYIAGMSTPQAVDLLCHWVQTAFTYKRDDDVWGDDRAFFAEETLFYPYADCEDRSILLTRIVRDLLHLDCALVYYPGHLATAIALGNDVTGDYITIHNKRFLICDPTYIGAPIGKTMTGMNNASAKVIVL